MPLTEDERQRLRDEELYRAQLRREMEPPRAPPARWSACRPSSRARWASGC
jgi:hypothetical protein